MRYAILVRAHPVYLVQGGKAKCTRTPQHHRQENVRDAPGKSLQTRIPPWIGRAFRDRIDRQDVNAEGAATSARKTAEKVSPACPEQHNGEQNPWAPPIPVGSEPPLLRKKHVGVRCYEAYDARGGPRPETEADLSAPNALSPIVAGPL